jgi:acetyl esterase/lipase
MPYTRQPPWIESMETVMKTLTSYLPTFTIVLFGTLVQAQTLTSAEVKIVKDISFLGADRKEKLDLYLPLEAGKQLRPAVVIVHGGGWHGGDKFANREQNIGKSLAEAGYVCASVNYRLCEKNDDLVVRLRQVFPGNVEDCRTAVRFLRRNAEQYQIDPDHIGAIGGSAGGHLVALMAVLDDVNTLGSKEKRLYPDYSSRVQAVVPMYGVHDVLKRARVDNKELNDEDVKLCRNASPVTHISSNDPPALILHGTKDDLVPVSQSKILHKQLTASTVPSELIIVEGAPHSFHLQPKQRDLRPVVIKFFDRHLKN